jgi:hypothetical protein
MIETLDTGKFKTTRKNLIAWVAGFVHAFVGKLIFFDCKCLVFFQDTETAFTVAA